MTITSKVDDATIERTARIAFPDARHVAVASRSVDGNAPLWSVQILRWGEDREWETVVETADKTSLLLQLRAAGERRRGLARELAK